MQSVTIKKAREGVLRSKHPWIFSGALEPIARSIQAGDICQVRNAAGTSLGFAFINPHTDLACRMLAFSKEFNPETFIEERISAAWAERKHLVPSSVSTAFRLINAEGDGLPGLIVDCYADTAVVQISTAGMERCKERVLARLRSLGIARAYEKSSSSARIHEGLPAENIQWLFGKPEQDGEYLTSIVEHGLQYKVSVESGQKTGFFLDQREMRLLLRQFAPGKSVLNCFAYSGGFSLNALKAGARSVVSIDSSHSACEAMSEHTELNGLAADNRHRILCEDVIRYLRTCDEKFDIIILDPPAYVKKAKDQKRGFQHYQELNRLGMQRLNKGGTLFTFSCSPFFNEDHWNDMLAAAMLASGSSLRMISQHRHALDHAVAFSHPEGRYLKGTVLKDFAYEE
jgi:23S rRNA (cytosine1962-C5)-methyltransferase